MKSLINLQSDPKLVLQTLSLFYSTHHSMYSLLGPKNINALISHLSLQSFLFLPRMFTSPSCRYFLPPFSHKYLFILTSTTGVLSSPCVLPQHLVRVHPSFPLLLDISIFNHYRPYSTLFAERLVNITKVYSPQCPVNHHSLASVTQCMAPSSWSCLLSK